MRPEMKLGFVMKKIYLRFTTWCSGYHYCTTSFSKVWTQVLRRFSSCSRRVGDSQWWRSLTMAPAGNEAKCLSSVNHTTKKKNNSSSIQFNSIAGGMKYNSFLFWSFDLLSLLLWNICMYRCFLSYYFNSGSVYVTFYHPKLISLLSKWP